MGNFQRRLEFSGEFLRLWFTPLYLKLIAAKKTPKTMAELQVYIAGWKILEKYLLLFPLLHELVRKIY